MDHLRLIANPYRLLSEATSHPTSHPTATIPYETQLMNLIQDKYKGVYLNPCFLKQVIQTIDQMVQGNIIDSVVEDLVQDAITFALQNNETRIQVET
jgi:hypothetical protein